MIVWSSTLYLVSLVWWPRYSPDSSMHHSTVQFVLLAQSESTLLVTWPSLNQLVNSFLGLKSLLYIFILYSPTSVALSIISSCIGDISAEDKVCFGITVSLRMHSQLFLTSSPPLDLGYMIPTKSSPQQIINLLTNWSLSLKVHTLNLRLVIKLHNKLKQFWWEKWGWHYIWFTIIQPLAIYIFPLLAADSSSSSPKVVVCCCLTMIKLENC